MSSKKKKKTKKLTKPDKRLMKTKEVEGHVGESVECDNLVDIPKYVNPNKLEAFRAMIHAVINGTLSNITKFCAKHTISRETLYRWMTRPETIEVIDQVIEMQVIADKVQTKELIRSQMVQNSAYARLYLEKYEKWSPEQPKTPAIQINFNFLKPSTAPDKPAIEADFEEVPS